MTFITAAFRSALSRAFGPAAALLAKAFTPDLLHACNHPCADCRPPQSRHLTRSLTFLKILRRFHPPFLHRGMITRIRHRKRNPMSDYYASLNIMLNLKCYGSYDIEYSGHSCRGKASM